MSDLIERAELSLANAEEELRRLAAEAVSSGQYDDVLTIAEWARQLAGVRGSSTPLRAASGLTNGVDALDGDEPTTVDVNGTSESYPKFCRIGVQLVKVSWSKRKREVYEHRASKDALVALLAGLSRAGARRKPIAIEALLPLRTPANEELPNYQVYVALSLLKERGVVEQHGRQGYRAKLGKLDPSAIAEDIWKSLPESSGR